MAAARVFVALLLIALGGTAFAAPKAASVPSSIRLSGVDYLELGGFCARFGLKSAGTPARRAVFKSEWTTLDFEIDSRDHLFNGLRVFSGEAVRSYRGKVWISEIDAEALVTPILGAGTNQARVPGLKTIVIDPGHGGRDPGKVNPRVKVMEKDLALDTARRAKALLEAQGYKVILTRSDDRYLDLPDRAKIASRHAPDLFISLHFNSVEAGAGRTTGVEVFSLTPRFQFSTADAAREDRVDAQKATPGNRFDHWNSAASYAIYRELVGTLGVSNRGLKRARWKVLTLAPCPAAYIEAGYLSNDAEARKIATPVYRQKIAEGILRGVQGYGARLEALRTRG